MKEITRTKRLEVAYYYILGYTFREIEEETGVSHGSVANIVIEIENGDLDIPGTPFDQVGDLRQLSLDLRKGGQIRPRSRGKSEFVSRCGCQSPTGGVKTHLLRFTESRTSISS